MTRAIVAVALLLLAVGFLLGAESCELLADDSPDPTCIGVHESDLPGAFYHRVFTDCIQAAETWRDARFISTHPASFRHFVHVSGPQACIFNVQTPNGAHGEWTDPGGGRHCAPGVDSGRCGYFSMGWNIVVASGQSCAAYGVPECDGSLCY